MIDKKKIIRLQYWEREDFTEVVFYLKRQVDAKLVRDKVKEIKNKYGIKYNHYDWYLWIKNYIIRTLWGVCLSDFGSRVQLKRERTKEEQEEFIKYLTNPIWR